MIKKITTWGVDHRYVVLGVIFLMTLIFGYYIKNIVIKTELTDLLPSTHPFIKIHEKYKAQLGGSIKVFMMLQVKDGNIYTKETLQKIVRITEGLDAIPGVNHNQIYSIGSRKLKKVKITGDAILSEDLMKEVPSSECAMDDLKKTIRSSPGVFGVWVSRDEKSVIFTAGFIEHLMNVDVIFKEARKLVEKETDKNHTIFMAGEPVLMGWVNHYQGEMWWIFGATMFALFAILYFYFRNLVGVVVPVVSTIMGAIWGLGFCGMIGYNLEPLILVIPLLITARALSHSVQVTERYFECYQESKDVREACIKAMTSIVPPGTLGIVTDVLGILFIAVAPIPMIQKLAYLCSFWAFSIIFTTLIFCPLVISFFKAPPNIADITDTEKGSTQWVLGIIARMSYGKGALVVLILTVIIAVFTGIAAYRVELGDVHPGSPILWENSNYNVAIATMNKNFPGTEELYVILEGSGPRAVESPGFLRIMNSFQRYMEKNSSAGRSLSLSDLLPPIYRAIYVGHPKFETLPLEKAQVSQIFYRVGAQAAPGDYDLYFSRDGSSATAIMWFKDHMGKTLRSAVATVKQFIKENEEALAKEKCAFRLASGNLGMTAAMNEAVADSQLLNMILVLGSCFILCALTYQSCVAALILMIPLNLANIITLAIMNGLDIGLNINTLPIVSVGVGVGIDYGIYLLSRFCEEYQVDGAYSLEVANRAIKTTGKAIFFTATTMVIGVLFWYFFSSMKFQAEMGLLLAIIMFLNMVGALVVIPMLLYVFKPKFLGRVKILL